MGWEGTSGKEEARAGATGNCHRQLHEVGSLPSSLTHCNLYLPSKRHTTYLPTLQVWTEPSPHVQAEVSVV